MHPEIFLEQKDISPLIRILTQFALRDSDNDDRQKALTIAGIDSSFLNRLRFGIAPVQFANQLASDFRDYRISSNEPTYHPMLCLLNHLRDQAASYGFSDDYQDLLTQLIEQGQENFKAIAARNTVGRIESPLGTGIGTGFLVGDGLLLTCDHVLRKTNVRQAWVRFGCKDKYSCQNKQAYELNLKPVSHRSQADYALMRIEPLPNSKPIQPVKIQPVDESLNSGQAVRLIHHGEGKPVVISNVGQILQVGADYIDHNLSTAEGSSGAPIFNADWELIALHQGIPSNRRSGIKDAVRGIPIQSIWQQIAPHLDYP